MLDPSIPFNNTETKIPGMELTVTIYEEPLVVYCILPGPLNYLSVTKPGKVVPLDAKMSQDTYVRGIITHICDLKSLHFQKFMHQNLQYILGPEFSYRRSI